MIRKHEWGGLAAKIHRDLAWLQRDTKKADWDTRKTSYHMINALTDLKNEYFRYVTESVDLDSGESIIVWDIVPKLREQERKIALKKEKEKVGRSSGGGSSTATIITNTIASTSTGTSSKRKGRGRGE